MIDVKLYKNRFKSNPFNILERFARERNLYFVNWSMWDNGNHYLVQFKHKIDVKAFEKYINLVDQNPFILSDRHGPLWTKFFKSILPKISKHCSITIGGETYIPYQFAYDAELKDYVWNFRKGGAEARSSVS